MASVASMKKVGIEWYFLSSSLHWEGKQMPSREHLYTCQEGTFPSTSASPQQGQSPQRVGGAADAVSETRSLLIRS